MEIPAREIVDVRGLICPMTWMKVRMRLSEMKTGEFIEVLIDGGDPIRNLPSSVKEEGHRIKGFLREGEYFRVIIEKGAL